MDLQKMGNFLKALRKEKGLTQEQFAEVMNVSNRTVSRWETGSNAPDLDVLMEISEYYDVDLSEILNGERKSEKMNEEFKDTVLQVADYSSEEKMKLLKRMHGIFIAGFIGFATFLIITALGLETIAPYGAICDFGLGLAFGITIVGVIFTSRYALKIREFKLRLLKKAKESR